MLTLLEKKNSTDSSESISLPNFMIETFIWEKGGPGKEKDRKTLVSIAKLNGETNLTQEKKTYK